MLRSACGCRAARGDCSSGWPTAAASLALVQTLLPLPTQVVFYGLTAVLVASFTLCVLVGHSFKTGARARVLPPGVFSKPLHGRRSAARPIPTRLEPLPPHPAPLPPAGTFPWLWPIKVLKVAVSFFFEVRPGGGAVCAATRPCVCMLHAGSVGQATPQRTLLDPRTPHNNLLWHPFRSSTLALWASSASPWTAPTTARAPRPTRQALVLAVLSVHVLRCESCCAALMALRLFHSIFTVTAPPLPPWCQHPPALPRPCRARPAAEVPRHAVLRHAPPGLHNHLHLHLRAGHGQSGGAGREWARSDDCLRGSLRGCVRGSWLACWEAGSTRLTHNTPAHASTTL